MTTEYSLISRAKEGDIKAFEELIYKYDKSVLAIAYSYRNFGDDAKDIYQEVFLRVYKNLKNFEGKSEFSTWLHRITVNVCITHYAKRKRHSYVSLHEPVEEEGEHPSMLAEIISDGYSSDRRMLEDEASENMQRLVNSLPAKQKMAVTLKYYHDLKIKEIAEVMSCNEGTIKRYLFDAMRKMRTKLRPD